MKKMRVVALFAVVLPFGGFAEARMAWAEVPKCSAWKLPDASVRSDVDSEWHEMDDGLWFTNSVGDRISIERYCATLSCGCERTAVPLLDKYYARCSPKAVRMIAGEMDDRKAAAFWNDHYTCDKAGNVLKGDPGSQVELTAWQIDGRICLLLDADDLGRMNMRMFSFVLFDGKDQRHLVTFDHLPDPRQANSILSVLTNPDAVNNLAVMIYKDEAWSHSVADDYVERLLMLAASFGSATACDNLVVLGQEEKWSKARIDRWRRFAKACREAAKDGIKPKMELKCISDWPLSWID